MSRGSAIDIPGYVAGTWTIDPGHSDIAFTVRHLMVSTIRGHFTRFKGEIVTGEDPLDSRVTAAIDTSSIHTNNEQRDADMRSADYLGIASHPEMTYRSTSVRREGDGLLVVGDLSLHGVTHEVPLRVKVNGIRRDPGGGIRAGFSATGEIDRRDFGITTNIPMDDGGVVVGEKIQILIDVETVLNQPEQGGT
jgi:polyisoprenoid-binding protein YceI